ncbi:MAG: peroxiredoxin family protein, partial [Actinomycetota bacterium]
MSTKTVKAGKRKSARRRGRHGLSSGAKVAAAILAGVAALAVIFVLSNKTGSGGSGDYAFQVGSPGPGRPAPPIHLASTEGGTFDLASLRGETVLLYFQEGVMCQPCWNQLKDIERSFADFQALGIDKIVTITTDPLDALRQKVADEGLSTPLLSDPGVRVSKVWQTNRYGMMGTRFNGHSFIVVDENGTILWRADYGG